MSKQWTPSKPTVELRQSRIRRDPVRADKPTDLTARNYWDPSEWETWAVVAGVVMFAIMLSAVIIGLSEITS
jgi:hypothetical protein